LRGEGRLGDDYRTNSAPVLGLKNLWFCLCSWWIRYYIMIENHSDFGVNI
jgi:hypothetical protein